MCLFIIMAIFEAKLMNNKYFMKKIILVMLLFLGFYTLKAQNINLGAQGAVLYDCNSNGHLYDFGGSNAGYTAGQAFTLVICPNPSLPAGTPLAFEFVSSSFGHPNDFLAFYDGAGSTAPADFIFSFNQTSSQTVGSTYRTTFNNLTGCITLQFFSDPASTGGNFDFKILCLPPCKSVVANNPLSSIPVQVTEPNYIHSCLTDAITFTGSAIYDTNLAGYTQADATSTFVWDFGPAGFDTGMVVSKGFNPGIYPIKLKVIDAAGCESLNETTLKVRQTIIPDLRFSPTDTIICLGDEIQVSTYIVSSGNDILHIGDTALFDTLRVQTSVSVQDTSYLPDDSDNMSGNGITTPAVFQFPIFGYQPGATLQNINDLFFVCLDIEHSFVGDLDIILQCPNGQTVDLIDFRPPGTPGWDLGEPAFGTGVQGVPYTYCWSPSANPGDSIAQFNANISLLPNGAVDTSFYYNVPGNDWSDLLGCPLNGTWTIQVFDDYGGDDGYVFGAAIEFNGDFALNPDTFVVAYQNPLWNASPQITSALNQDNVNFKAVSNPAQPITLNFTDNLGCDWTKTYDGVSVSVIEVNNLFKDTSICSADTLTISANLTNTFTYCNYIIEMSDSWGDGWTGAFVQIFADGVLLGNFDVDYIEGTFSAESFAVTHGQVLQFKYDNTNEFWGNEISFKVKDAQGNYIFSSGQNPAAGIIFTTTSNCLGSNTYDWGSTSSFVSTNQNIATVYPLTTNKYWVKVTNEYGCFASDTSTVTFDGTNTPQLNFNNLPVEFCCSGTELVVDVTNYVSGPAISKIFVNGEENTSFLVSSEDFEGEDVMTYTVQVLAQNGCTAQEILELHRNCIEPSIMVADTIFVGDSKVFESTVNPFDSLAYNWTTNDNSKGAIVNPAAQNAEFKGIYENIYQAGLDVTAYIPQNNNTVLECVESAELQSYEVVDILELRYPDAFTPNNDDINNVFRPIMSEYGEIVDFRVYNRWGDLVYDRAKSDNKDGWDGKLNGKDQAPGLYIYYISIKSFNEIITKEASVTLLR